MLIPIKREQPTPDEMAKDLAARLERQGRRDVSTIGPAPETRCVKCRARSERSRRHCHLPAEPKARHPSPRDNGKYVPEMAARIEDDRNLTDGARRCARKIAEYIYRKNREDREAEITVTYLVKALGRCRRTVQRYLRQLEAEGYIDVFVIPSLRTRMCFGLRIRLLNPLLPRHRRHQWPAKARNPVATTESQNYIQSFKGRPIRRALWAFFCCDGVWRSHMKTIPPFSSITLT